MRDSVRPRAGGRGRLVAGRGMRGCAAVPDPPRRRSAVSAAPLEGTLRAVGAGLPNGNGAGEGSRVRSETIALRRNSRTIDHQIAPQEGGDPRLSQIGEQTWATPRAGDCRGVRFTVTATFSSLPHLRRCRSSGRHSDAASPPGAPAAVQATAARTRRIATGRGPRFRRPAVSRGSVRRRSTGQPHGGGVPPPQGRPPAFKRPAARMRCIPPRALAAVQLAGNTDAGRRRAAAQAAPPASRLGSVR